MVTPGSASPRRPEQGLILLIDGDPVPIGIRHREGPAEWAVDGLRQDRYAVRRDLLKECLRVACPPPQLDARRVGRRSGQIRSGHGGQRECRPADEYRRAWAEVERVAYCAEVSLVKAGGS